MKLRPLIVNGFVFCLSLFATITLNAQVRYRVIDNKPDDWHWLASASLHTQNFNSANLRFAGKFKAVDWLLLHGDATLPLYAHAFSGDAHSAQTMFANATAILRWGGTFREKERVTTSSSISESGGTRTHSVSYFEADLQVYSYIALRGGLFFQNMTQPINARMFDISNEAGTAHIADSNWSGETRAKSATLHAGFEWGRDSHANVEYGGDEAEGNAHVCYNARYYLDFLYAPSVQYDNFSASGTSYVVSKKSERSYTQMGGRFGFEQNFRWWTWGAELGLQRRFGDGESTKLSENGYGYLNFFFGFSMGDWAASR